MIEIIEPIYKDSYSAKDEAYRLLNMVHVLAGQLAQYKDSGWKLKSCYTGEGEADTTWTNGIVDVTAQSSNGNHWYSLIEAEK